MRASTIISLAAALMGTGEATPLNSSETSTKQPSVKCGIPGYTMANQIEIADGTKYLKGLSGYATLGHKEGGGWCFRYSCAWGAGIYGCNDNQFDVEVPWSTLAAYAQDIQDKCTWQQGQVYMVQGQAFDSGNWNVVVGLEQGTTC